MTPAAESALACLRGAGLPGQETQEWSAAFPSWRRRVRIRR